MANANLISVLNEALRVEHTLAMQCQHYSLMVSGLWRIPLVPFFEELAGEAQEHARKFGRKVVALGGVPATQVEAVQESRAAEDMIRDVLTLEHRARDIYLRALDAVPEGDIALRTMLEDHVESEQRHIDELERIAVEPSAGGHKAENSAAIRRAS